MGRRPRSSELDQTKMPSRLVADLADAVLDKITHSFDQKPELVFDVFYKSVSEKIRPLVKPVAFTNRRLVVKVKNATLFSILVSQEKKRLIGVLRSKLPHLEIEDISFQIG